MVIILVTNPDGEAQAKPSASVLPEIPAICKIMEFPASLCTTVNHSFGTSDTSPLSDNTITKIIKYLNLHFRDEINCDIPAQNFHMSNCHLPGLFKEHTGVSPREYVIKRRILYFNDLIRKNVTLRIQKAGCACPPNASLI